MAENFQALPKPFRRYQVGTVWRNEKPGPGRYREFTQCDADTVGSASPAADAELMMMFADAMEAVGLKRGEYVIKVNSRKLLDGVLEAAGVRRSAKRGDGVCARSTSSTGWASTACARSWAPGARTSRATSPRART